MYTNIQKQIIKHTKDKVLELFLKYAVPAHGIDHVERVLSWIIKIAKAEKANVFLCEMSALLHDTGRTLESANPGVRHHDLSYKIVQEWFRNDSVYNQLSKKEKITILYSIKYHWNEAATKYFEAVILRDADKIDSFGAIGVQREIAFKKEVKDRTQGMRFRYASYYWVVTKTAKNIMKKNNFIKPIDNYYLKLLKNEITPVEV